MFIFYNQEYCELEKTKFAETNHVHSHADS